MHIQLHCSVCVHTWLLFSPLQCPLVVCLQQHYLCRHYLCSNSTLSFGGLPTTTLSVHALPVFSPLMSFHGLPTTLQHYLCMHGPCSHLCSVLRWSTYNSTPLHAWWKSHLCSVPRWSTHNNTATAGVTRGLTYVVSLGGLPTTTLPLQVWQEVSPM